MARHGINKVILIGNLGKDPDVRRMPNGDPVASFSLATSESWKDKNTGENKEITEWHRVVIFGRTAEIAEQYLHKGSKVYIEGKLRTRKWQGQDGLDRYTTEVVVDLTGSMQMLDKSATGGSGDFESGYQTAARPTATAYAPTSSPSAHAALEHDDPEDPIPF